MKTRGMWAALRELPAHSIPSEGCPRGIYPASGLSTGASPLANYLQSLLMRVLFIRTAMIKLHCL
jgi:hypothetical protein